MGVEGLRNFFNKNIKFKGSFVKNLPKDISSLFIDCNGIIHQTAAKIYHLPSDKDTDEVKKEKLKNRKKLLKRSRKNLEKLHIKEVINKFIFFIEEVKPEDNLILAVDGIGNSAKLNQQKQRRFKKTLEVHDETVIFDTNAITPGTQFMINLDKEIEKWLKNYKEYLPKKVIYSSHLSPGEGEHKIFEYIRKEKIIEGSGANVIIGMDNDLIILCALSRLDRFYMKAEESGKSLVDIDMIKKGLINELEFPNCNKKLLIQDFSVIAMLVGNDFLPKFPNIGSLRNALSFLFMIYKKFNRKHLTDSENKINWKNYSSLLFSYDRYKSSESRGYKYLELFLNNPYTIKPYPEIEQSIIVLDKGGKKTNQVFNPENHTLQFDENLFSKKWYKKQFNTEILQYDSDVKKTYDTLSVRKMCVNYLRTIQWVQYYYTKGFNYVSKLYFYHYMYTPLMSSVITVLNSLTEQKKTGILDDVKKDKDNIEITAVHQLMSVLPKKSLQLVPEEYREIYLKELMDINPEIFKVSDEATYKEHQSKAILPTINMNLVDVALREKDFDLPKSLREKSDLILNKK